MPTFLNSCDGLAVYGEKRINGESLLDGWLEKLGLTPVSESAVDVQEAGTEILALENLPAYDYKQQEIEMENQGQWIYGVAYIPNTDL